MTGSKRKHVVNCSNATPNKKRKEGRSETAISCGKNTVAEEAKVSDIFSDSNDQIKIEHLLEQIVHNFFDDPQNIRNLKEYLTRLSFQKKQYQGRQSRDVSNYEVIRPRDLPTICGISKTNIWRLEKAGQFVEKIKLSAGAVGYRRVDIENWLAARQLVKGGNHE